jgi:hypothetical protein
MSQRIEGVLRNVEAMDELAGRVRRRAEFLRETVSYRRDSDTVPVPDSLSSVPVQLGTDNEPRPTRGREVAVNVLADEYWDIYAVLLS